LTKTLFETGIDSDLDVAQADSLLETTLAQATALGIQRAQYEHAIACSWASRLPRFPSNPRRGPTSRRSCRWDAGATAGTPAGHRRRRARRGRGNASIGVARAAYYPTISLTGGTGLAKLDDVQTAGILQFLLGAGRGGFGNYI
jgi:outer membrane protein TolC